MPIGVQGYTTRYRTYNAAQVEEAYKKIAAMGYDGVESGLGGRVMDAEEDAAMMRQYGLKAADVYGDLTKPDEVIRRAEIYGVKITGLPSVPGEMMHSVEGFKAHAEKINELARPFKGTGMKLQYHNHSQEFRNFPQLNGKAGLAILIEETDPEMVVFELDVFWMSAAGCDPVQWINKVNGRIPIIHFKDLAIDWKSEGTDMGLVNRRYAEIGQGNVNWPPIVDASVKAGVEWYCVEQDRTVLDEFECLKISVDYMRGIGIK
jgi:sugar phosphate isomerase/epimerase